MDVYTIQMARWRKAKELGIYLLDTTAKSGDKVFAPSWGIVAASKKGEITEQEYTQEYRKQMVRSFRTHMARWKEVITEEPIAIACYCGPDKFCHRHLLAAFFREICESRGIPYVYGGEIR